MNIIILLFNVVFVLATSDNVSQST